MRHAKLFGIALLATMVTVGCGQAPTMNTDVQGYGGYKKVDKKKLKPDVKQVNVIKDLNIGHLIEQDQEIEQALEASQANTSTQTTNTAVSSDANVTTLQQNESTNGTTAIQFSSQENEVEQEAEQDQTAVIVGDIKDVKIKQSNAIGKRGFKKRFWD